MKLATLLLVAAAAPVACSVQLRGSRSAVVTARSASTAAALRLRGGQLIEDGGGIVDIETEEELDMLLEEAGSRLVVVDFFAEWCGPCKKLAPLFETLAKQAGSKVVFAKVDVDAARELSAARGVKSMPTSELWQSPNPSVHRCAARSLAPNLIV